MAHSPVTHLYIIHVTSAKLINCYGDRKKLKYLLPDPTLKKICCTLVYSIIHPRNIYICTNYIFVFTNPSDNTATVQL